MKNIIFILILSIYICIGQDILNPDPVIGDINGLSNRTNNELQGIRRGWNWENELKKLIIEANEFINMMKLIIMTKGMFTFFTKCFYCPQAI